MSFLELSKLWAASDRDIMLVWISSDGRYLIDCMRGVMDMYSRRGPGYHYQLTDAAVYEELKAINPPGMVVWNGNR